MTYASFESSSVLMSKFMCPLGSSSRWSLTARQQRGTCFLLGLEDLELLLDERCAWVVRGEHEELPVRGDRGLDVVRALRRDAELEEDAGVRRREEREILVDLCGLAVGILGPEVGRRGSIVGV